MPTLQLTLDRPSADLTNFPLTLFLSAAAGKTDFDASAIFAELGSSWNKLIITDAADTSLPIEMELWDAANSTAVLHVKVPAVSSSTYTTLIIDYASTNGVNPNIGIIGSTVGKSVWDSNYLAVYHMCQDPSAGGACVLDSTSNVRHLIPYGSMTSGDLVDSMVGKGLDFDDIDDYLYNAGLRLTASMSYDVCINVPNVTGTKGIWHQGNQAAYEQQGSFLKLENAAVQLMNLSGEWRYYASTTSVSANANTVISASYDSSAALTAKYCVNGTENTVTMAQALAISTGYGLYVACAWANGVSHKYQGQLDELRISNIARSAAWVTYSNKSLRDDAVTIGVAVSTIKALLVQLYDLSVNLLYGISEQPYNLATQFLAKLDQLYGLQLLALLAQHYGDVPVVRQLLDQYWGPAALLRLLNAQPYGDALRLRQSLDQDWGLNAGLLAMMEQRYAVAGSQYRALAEQAYNINEYQLLRRTLEQISVIAADTALLQQPVVAVTADGEPLDVSHISIDIDEETLAITGEIHPADQSGFLRCRHLETAVTVTIDADVYSLIVEAPRSSRPQVGQEIYIVPLASPTIKLDAPYAVPLTQEFGGAMASTIVAGLAAIEGIAVVWTMVDWYLPAGSLYANAETPLAVIRKLVAAAGGLLQTSPAGELLCRAEYPLPLPSWPTATPAHYLTDMDNFFSVDSTPEIRDGYNKFLVADQDAAADLGLTLDQIDIDEHKKEVRVYQVPYNSAAVISLQTSGGSWVGIVSDGVVVETLTEQVEIVAGEGHTAKPITAKTSHDYRETVLGAITVAEDGHLATEIAGNSLVEIVYTTTYRKYIVSDPQIEDVQFYPVEVSA